MKIVTMIVLALSTLLMGCSGETGEAKAETRSVTFGGSEYTVPEYVFENEPFKYTVLENGELKELSGLITKPTLDACCNFFVGLVDGEAKYINMPTYAEVPYVGPPLTLPANQTHVIKVALNTEPLNFLSDQIADISWQQTAGESSYETDASGLSLSFEAPEVTEIERWVFAVKVTTVLGHTFEREKVVFVVPQNDWLSATQVYQGSDRSEIVVRENNSFVYLEEDLQIKSDAYYFSEVLDQPIKLVASENIQAHVVTEDNQLRTYRNGNESIILQDFGNITEMVGVVSARTTTLIVNEGGGVFTSFADYRVELSDAVSVTPQLLRHIYLNQQGEIVDERSGVTLAENIQQLSVFAYLTDDGRVGIIDYGTTGLIEARELSAFNQYNDYTYVTSPNLGEKAYGNTVFALRENNTVVSNVRLPPTLDNIIQLSGSSALHRDGWVYHMNSYNYGNEGLLPNPVNLTKDAFERFLDSQ